MPIDYKEYPKNWKWLSKQIRKRNDGRCELCNAPNGGYVYRPKEKADYPWYKSIFMTNVEFFKCVKIVLTVHHIDSNKKNNNEQNLISLCQKCHCRLNLVEHIKHSKETRAKKRLQKNMSLSIHLKNRKNII